MPNQPLVDIVNPKDILVVTSIDTRISGKIKVGNDATIKLRSSKIIYNAKVSNIKPINNKVTYEREIDVVFEKLPLAFYLQEQANVKIKIGTLNKIYKIPNEAISYYKKQEGVWILRDEIVTFKPIIIAAHGVDFIATKTAITDKVIIPDTKKKGLSEGMTIYHD
jgi:hypothetical protein